MNELTCTICFTNRPRFLRQCRCLYCEDCRQKGMEVCSCGGAGGYHDLNQCIPDEIKYLHLDSAQLLKKTMDTLQERLVGILQGSFGFLNNVFELKSHHQKQLQKFLLNKVKAMQCENEEMKKRFKPAPQFDVKESLVNISQLEEFKFTTPRGIRPVASVSNSKRPFDHEAFASFFSKK